ncbi:MAG: transporter substrate-binding domain-containing protein [Eubacterium sp.]|nr:transporter substrate-binding domain-containing protein [Eubacterium sp.]
MRKLYRAVSRKTRLFLSALALLMAVALPVFVPAQAYARQSRTVRVAFFPMESYHTYSQTEGYGGMDVAYLEQLCIYTGWDIEYVDCDSWDDALDKLEAKEVDLVGSAQYSEERAQRFDYASLASGYTYGCLFVEGDSTVAYEDFEHMRDMKFGMVASYIRKGEFLEYLERNGLDDPHLQEYDTTQDLQDALKAGEIDVAVHTLTEVREGQCLVGKFAYAPYYYITWEGNTALLDELNRGIEEINVDTPPLDQELVSLYYGDRRENFAAGEQAFIDQGSVVRIGFYKDTKPLAYINDQGESDGIYIQILKKISERSGINMELVPLERSEYWKELLRSGEIDFYVGANSMQLVRDEDMKLTSAFMNYNAVIVSKSDYVHSDDDAVMVLTNGRTYWADSMDISGQVIYCDSAKDCLQAIKRGDADITLLNTIEYNYQSKNERFSDLIEWDNYRYQSGAALAAMEDTDPVLFNVMNKSLRLISETEKDDIINQYMNISYDSYEWIDYLHQSKDVIIVASVILILVLLFGGAILRVRRKAYHLLEIKNGELQVAIHEAEKANQAKTEFLSHMSHDIRTPINGIMGMLNIAEDHPEDAERQADCRKKIKASTQHLLSLINDVLDINKMESGNIEFAREIFSLREMLQNCAVIIGGQAAAKGVELTLDFTEPELLPHEYFVGSPLHIKQVLMNIANNSIKYNKPSGSVDLRCYEMLEVDGIAQICFEIADTGIGMSKEFLNHIFEPFTQENGGARTNYQGTGLGMTITKKLVDSMDGTIQIESELGRGTIFTVILPLELAELTEKKEEKKEDRRVKLAGKKVLLVEDNELNQEIAQYMLEENGVEVTVAADGKEAVDLFEESDPGTYQIILMDLMMPVMDGHEATRTIRSLARPDAASIPIVAMTANAFAEDVQASMEAGMNEHIAKPLEPEVIEDVLIRWIGEE